MTSASWMDDLEGVRVGVEAAGVAVRSLNRRARRRPSAHSSMRVTPRVAWSPRVPPELRLEDVADPLARRLPENGFTTWDVPLPDGVLRMGKFTREEQVKVREYLLHDGRPATLKAWMSAKGVRRHGRWERRVRKKVQGIAHYRTPQLIASGASRSVDYLVESLVYGRHPSSPEGRLAAVEDLVPSLAAAYRRTDRGDVALSDYVRPDFRQRVLATLESDAGWDPAYGARDRVVERVAALVDADRRLRVAIGHGDLVSTNIICDAAGRHYLCDWEHGGVMPVAFDLVKLLLMTGRPAEACAHIDRQQRGFLSPSRQAYNVEEQLALGLCLSLSWTPERRDRAGRAGRTEQFEAEQRSRLTWLAMLLDC